MPDLALSLDVSVWRACVDILLVSALIYRVLLLLRGSRSGAVLAAAALLFGGFYLSQDTLLDLPTVNWLLDRLIGSLVVLLVVLFQDDIRRALASAVRAPLWRAGTDPRQDAVVSEVQRAAGVLGQRGIGALIVIEHDAPLDRYVEAGVQIDAAISWQLLISLFVPSHRNPTHDGAVIISKGRVAAAGCFLPLAGGEDLPEGLGSRHRAALGVADETDAIVVAVSEETGRMAVAHMGRLDLELGPDDLRERMSQIAQARTEANGEHRWRRRIVHHNRPRPADPGAAARTTSQFTASQRDAMLAFTTQPVPLAAVQPTPAGATSSSPTVVTPIVMPAAKAPGAGDSDSDKGAE